MKELGHIVLVILLVIIAAKLLHDADVLSWRVALVPGR